MANSQTDILNKALTLVGAAPVVSINDGTTNANICANVYAIALQSVLSECKWNFATTRAKLSLLTSGSTGYPAFLYMNEQFVYQLPTDVIGIFGFNPGSAQCREENGVLISDSADLGILYVYYDDDPGDYPSYFLEAFIDKLCSDIAYMIINSATIAESFVKKYETVSLPKALSRNSQTGIQQTMIDDQWTRAKFQDGGDYDPWGAVAL